MPMEYNQQKAKQRPLEWGNADCNWPLAETGHRTNLALEIPLDAAARVIPWIPDPMEGPGNAVADDLEC